MTLDSMRSKHILCQLVSNFNIYHLIEMMH